MNMESIQRSDSMIIIPPGFFPEKFMLALASARLLYINLIQQEKRLFYKPLQILYLLMVSKQATYEIDLGNGLSLHAFAIDPAITAADLAGMLSSRDGTAPKFDLKSLEANLRMKAIVPSLSGLEVAVSDERYVVPEQFRPYREALEDGLLRRGMFNGPVMVVKGVLGNQLTLCRGGFFDFKATQLSAIPAEVLPNSYPQGKTIGDLLPEYGLDVSRMARYLGFAFVMMPNNGDELSFVQRAKGMGIAADIMALSGATPPFHEDFFKTNFDSAGYFRGVVERELMEEFKLPSKEFGIKTCYLIDDIKSVPSVAVEIVTPVTTGEIAARVYGDPEAMKEHPVVFSIKADVGAVSALLNRFPLLYHSAYVMHMVANRKEV